jgi:ADP-ribosylglycohydrolase
MGGDCDTVGAIACQIAGAIYGFSSDLIELYSQMKDFTNKRYSVFIKAYKLAKGKERKITFNTI